MLFQLSQVGKIIEDGNLPEGRSYIHSACRRVNMSIRELSEQASSLLRTRSWNLPRTCKLYSLNEGRFICSWKTKKQVQKRVTWMASVDKETDRHMFGKCFFFFLIASVSFEALSVLNASRKISAGPINVSDPCELHNIVTSLFFFGLGT